MAKRLTAKFVQTTKKLGKHYDGEGLFLRVTEAGSKSWIWQGTIRGRGRVLRGLGSFRDVTLAEARDQAREYRKHARNGVDPVDVLKRDATPTFAEAFHAVLATRRADWKPGSQSEQDWRRTVETYAARLTRRPVDQISAGDVLDVLTPIWSSKNVTAKRLRDRISIVMRWAITKGYRTDDPASKAVAASLPKHNGPQKHLAALPHAEVAEVLREIRESRSWLGIRLMIEFTILTAARSGEVRLATWAEVEVEAAVWIVPAARMKAGREHRVPLSAAALAVLDQAKTLTDGHGLIFGSARSNGPLHRSTPPGVLRELGIPSTLHGFRSSFRDWCGETGVPREVAEHSLAHVVPGVEGAYARSDLLERRRPVMEDWGAYCHRP